jgi:hypothetical protein
LRQRDRLEPQAAWVGFQLQIQRVNLHTFDGEKTIRQHDGIGVLGFNAIRE